MSLTIDCGEGKHGVCSGSGTQAYLFPQLEGKFNCGCLCHHEGILRGNVRIKGVPCREC